MTKPRSALTRAGFLTDQHLRCVMANGDSTQAAISSELKVCTKCDKAKLRSEFHVGKEYPDGRKATCKICMQIQRRAKYHSQREDELSKRRARKATDEWQALKPQREARARARLEKRISQSMPSERCCTSCDTVLPATREHFNKSHKGSFGLTASCRGCLKTAYEKRARENPEVLRERARKHYAKYAPVKLALQKIKRLTDPAFAIHMRVSSSVRQSLNRTSLGTSWIRLLNFSAQELREHLEKKFTEGMTWDKFLAGEIEIDHVIPVAFFRPESPDCLEFHMCWNLKNLQPLWRVDNRRKRDILPANFPELWDQLFYEATQNAA